MTTTAFYTLVAMPAWAGSALARRGRVVVAWLLVLATVIAASPVPLHLQLIPDRGLS